jgi:hypothetical protein
MAVTYAWRLDSDKYAYIVPPYTLQSVSSGTSLDYGFLSKSPLNGYALRNVAESAESMFGKNLSAYTNAFAAMKTKIDLASTDVYTQTLTGGTEEVFSGWTILQNADFLSADVYYNVDSTDCADLRGVGIKGTRYLGAFPSLNGGVDLQNLTFDTTIRAGMQGYTDVYGIYLTDNIEENGEVRDTTNAPEYMFVIRNGEKGERGEQGPVVDVSDSAVTQNLVTKNEFNNLQSQVAYKTDLDGINNTLEQLTRHYNTISLDNVNTLMVMVSNLQNQISRLQDYIFNINIEVNNNSGGGDNPIVPGGNVEIVPLGRIGDDYNDYEPESGNVANIEGWETEIRDIASKKFHLLGYLEDSNLGDDYEPIGDDGYRKNFTAKRLYSLPNIAVSLTGITFGVDYAMHVEVPSGDTIVQNIQVNNIKVNEKGYAPNGLYHMDLPEGEGFVEFDEFNEESDFKEPKQN